MVNYGTAAEVRVAMSEAYTKFKSCFLPAAGASQMSMSVDEVLAAVRDHVGDDESESDETPDGGGKKSWVNSFSGIPARLLGSVWRTAVIGALGPFSEPGNRYIVHLDEEMVHALLLARGSYDSVACSEDVVTWNMKKVRSGDTRFAFHTPVAVDAESVEGVRMSVSYPGQVQMGERTMIMLATGKDPQPGAVITVGALTIHPPVGYPHFGVSVPTELMQHVVIHLPPKVMGAYGYMQTGAINKTVGELAEIVGGKPTIKLEGLLKNAMVPPSPMAYDNSYKLRWCTSRQVAVSLMSVAHFSLSALELSATMPMDFTLIVTAPGDGTVSNVCGHPWATKKTSEEMEVARKIKSEVMTQWSELAVEGEQAEYYDADQAVTRFGTTWIVARGRVKDVQFAHAAQFLGPAYVAKL